MSTICVVQNLLRGVPDFICDRQATIDSAPQIPGRFSVGTLQAAQELAEQNKKDWITHNAAQFLVYRSIIDENGHHTWQACDLTTEGDNNHIFYNLLNFPYGNWSNALGLADAKKQLEQIQEHAANVVNLNFISVWNSWSGAT